MFTTAETEGLAEWIIDNLFYYIFHLFLMHGFEKEPGQA